MSVNSSKKFNHSQAREEDEILLLKASMVMLFKSCGQYVQISCEKHWQMSSSKQSHIVHGLIRPLSLSEKTSDPILVAAAAHVGTFRAVYRTYLHDTMNDSLLFSFLHFLHVFIDSGD